MSISFSCSCGKCLLVKNDMEGKRIPCPECGERLLVPPTSQAEVSAGSAGGRRQASKRARPKREPSGAARPALPIWLGVAFGLGGVLVVGIPVVLLVLWFTARTPTPAPEKSAPVAAVADETAKPDKPDPDVKQETSPPVTPPQPERPAGESTRPALDPAVRLVAFGPARVDGDEFTGRNWTGVLVEVTAASPGKSVRLDAASIGAYAAEKRHPAVVVFIASGRDALEPTAKVLAGTVGRMADVAIGKSRFSPTVPPAVQGLREASSKAESRGKVNPPRSRVIDVTDLILALPLHVARGGGAEFGLPSGGKVRFGLVFAVDSSKLASVVLLGHTLRLEASLRDDGPLPAPVARAPLGGMGRPANPEDRTPLENSGWWVVPAAGGAPRDLEVGFGYASAVTRDLKTVAVFRASSDAPEVKSALKPGDQVAIGPVGKPPRPVWSAGGRAAALLPNARMQWSPAGGRLFIAGHQTVLTLDTRGKSRLFGSALSLLDTSKARWTGAKGIEVAVIVRAAQSRLVLLNAVTGQQRDLCPLPAGFAMPSFDLSADQRTVAFFIARSLDLEGVSGVWLWRRGQTAPVRVLRGEALAGAVSPDGRHIVIALREGEERRTVLWSVANRKEVWRADCPASGYAFDPTSKQLAITTGEQGQVLKTALDRYDPSELVKGKAHTASPCWSADGRQILFRRLSRRGR